MLIRQARVARLFTSSGAAVVTDADVETYLRDGVVLLRGVLSTEDLRLAERAIDLAIRSPGPWAEFIGADTTWEDIFQEGAEREERGDWVMFQDQFASHRIPEMRSFIRDTPLPGLMARLMGSQTLDFFYDHVIVKRPDPDATKAVIPWHQDLPCESSCLPQTAPVISYALYRC